MVTPMEKPVLKEENHIHDYEDSGSSTGCGCFWFLGFKRPRNNENGGDKRQVRKETTWWVKKMNKVKELSEVVAGPKWKTFIRKVGGYCKGKKQKNTRFQYDPQSYALNFDCGVDAAEEEEEEDGPLLDISSRFTAPLGSENRSL
ncbi:hypothetical protein L484_007613 [Morus notabilis]|uniref:Stress induced protein n=1 Tax=Morus notabilis TaxID=981085 RepID=W9RT03_9ROSA|nr:uncharacterized protein LOC21391008 [Morus notabilis]EXC06933.1 hypothetical protein L484_007613 [Morus notabilis]